MGFMAVSPSHGANTELCLELIDAKAQGTPVFKQLAVIRFSETISKPVAKHTTQRARHKHTRVHVQKSEAHLKSANITAASQPEAAAWPAMAMDSTAEQQSQQAIPVAEPAPGLNITGEYKWLTQLLPAQPTMAAAEDAGSAAAESSDSNDTAADDWTKIRMMNGW